MPHDALVKAVFSKLRHARGLLRELLPEPLRRRTDFRTLRLESGIAVDDEELDEQRMDLLYSARVGQRRALFYVLFEHQSRVDHWMAFRLLCYLVAIWKSCRAQNPRAKKLPAIFPLVMHHSRSGWTASAVFEELLDLDKDLLGAIGSYVPRFRFLLDDLPAQSDEALRARRRMTPGGRTAILALKYGRERIALRIRVLSQDARDPRARDVLALVLRYITETSHTPTGTLQRLLAEQVGPKVAEEVMTLAERLRREGRREGETTGMR